MNESFDQELSRAFKESTAKSLQGWEFTPAMRKQVMERIRQEEAGAPTPADPPVRKIRPAALTRPVAWVAVAAAAVVLALQIDLSGVGFGSMKKTESPTAAPMTAAKESAPAAEDMKSLEDQGAANRAAMAPAPEVGAAKMSNVPVIALEAPAAEQVQTTGAPAPGAAYTMARVAANVDMAVPPAGTNAVTLSEDSLKVVTPSNSVAWERPLPAASLMAIAADGSIAVGNALNELRLVSADGQKEQVVQVTAPIQNLAWSSDGRVAAAEGALTFVYSARDGKQAFKVDAGTEADLAWAPDGTLATLGTYGPDRLLSLTDRTGKVTARATTEGRGVVFAQNGTVVVAGNDAFDRSGQPLWHLSMVTEGLIAVDQEAVAAWDRGRLLLVDVKSGLALWQASLEVGNSWVQKVTPSPDGRLLAVVAPDANGGGLVWVLTRDGRLLYQERLGELPVDVAFSGNQLILLFSHSVQMRPLPQ